MVKYIFRFVHSIAEVKSSDFDIITCYNRTIGFEFMPFDKRQPCKAAPSWRFLGFFTEIQPKKFVKRFFPLYLFDRSSPTMFMHMNRSVLKGIFNFLDL